MRPGWLVLRASLAVLAAGLLASSSVRADGADDGEEELAYSRAGGWVGLGGAYAQENFSGVGSYDNSGSLLFRAGYRGLPNVAVEFLGEVLPEFQSDGASDGDVDGFAVTANLKLLLPLGPIEPYAALGLGILDIDSDERSREDDFAFRFAGGLDLYLTPHWVLYGEAAYMLPTGDVDDYDYATFGAGFLFRF